MRKQQHNLIEQRKHKSMDGSCDKSAVISKSAVVGAERQAGSASSAGNILKEIHPVALQTGLAGTYLRTVATSQWAYEGIEPRNSTELADSCIENVAPGEDGVDFAMLYFLRSQP